MASYLETRYLAPTNTRGARIKVVGAGSRITLGEFDFDYAAQCAHRAAVETIRHENAYTVERAFATDRGYVFRVVHESEVSA
jgi:hypothetical protein